jgi:UDP-N-acetylglucosamine 2-epimerase (hydrolysing)
MLPKKRIVFLTGTRADFGKLKSLIEITNRSEDLEVHIFATGMHMQAKYGGTVNEIEKCGYPNIYKFINHTTEDRMDLVLSRTIEGLSGFCQEIRPDLIIIHGDRVEALSGAIVGALNNILVAHIEGGEISGTIDELIRHAVSKMSHMHFVAHEDAKRRLIQMGEYENCIHVIGSPDVDLMLSDKLPSIASVKEYYNIQFPEYAIVMFHPVTTEVDNIEQYANSFVDALEQSGLNYVVIFPNNDMGSSDIFRAYERIENNPKYRLFPSIRFESFLILLKNAKFIIGNSSSGIREAPYYGVPAVNVGTRQFNRALQQDIINTSYESESILKGIGIAMKTKPAKVDMYGKGNSDELFKDILMSPGFWEVSKQKHFRDI